MLFCCPITEEKERETPKSSAMSAQQEAFRDGQGFILFSTHRERVEEQDRGNGDQSSQVLIYFFMSGRD